MHRSLSVVTLAAVTLVGCPNDRLQTDPDPTTGDDTADPAPPDTRRGDPDDAGPAETDSAPADSAPGDDADTAADTGGDSQNTTDVSDATDPSARTAITFDDESYLDTFSWAKSGESACDDYPCAVNRNLVDDSARDGRALEILWREGRHQGAPMSMNLREA